MTRPATGTEEDQLREASAAQRRAADPGTSVWLSANAGSGKTRVLTDRVARLLVAGVDPQSILCLTYTKAAAGEMQNRLFDRLGAWSMRADAELRDELATLGEEAAPGSAALARARTLFAQAIETPGGLKIQTIHAFCAGLLRRFPLEAGVSPRFVEIDDITARALRSEVLTEIAETEPARLDAILRHLGSSLDATAAALLEKRDGFSAPLSLEDARALFGLPPGLSEGTLLWRILRPGTPALLRRLRDALLASGPRDQAAGEKLAALDLDILRFEDLPILESVFLTGATAKEPFCPKAGAFPTKAARAELTDVCEELDALADRIADARPLRTGLVCAAETHALHDLAALLLPIYARRKAERGWVDFADLILRARALLADPGVADWVLYRLDGGLDHILVDEAQDTNPPQWQVIEQLATEFAAGGEARGRLPRSIFVVGDRKQSIFSFQGADPRAFDSVGLRFEERRGEGFTRIEMAHSFRSSPAILRAVDATFAGEAGRGLAAEVSHRAIRAGLPGRVDLWPQILPAEAEARGPEWWEPVDRVAPDAPASRLARGLAAWLGERIRGGEALPRPSGPPRPLTEGDVMILVRRRSAFFHEMIRALKAERLAVAGADRLRLEAELAVKDLVALLSFLALPEDSLSLAAALRSPLFGWSEAQLYALAAPRPERATLWQALRVERGAHPETLAILDDLRSRADFLRPYELLERVLVRHDGRRRLLARLGPEAEDGIDALLDQALAYEDAGPPSLTGFLAWFEAETIDQKRQLGSAGGRIRVMTIHGSKGLESPLVILPDTMMARAPTLPGILDAEPPPVWRTAKDRRHDRVGAAEAAAAAARDDELSRLLYVAMTRAETWLLVAGAGKGAAGSWHPQVAAALHAMGAVPLETPLGEGLRYAYGDWPPPMPREDREDAPPPPPPDWLRRAAPPAAPALPLLSPSDLGGEKTLPGERAGLTQEAAMRRGTLLHRLLEHLPAGGGAGAPMLAQALADVEPAEAAGLAAEAAALVDAPALAEVFAPGALAEVEVAGEIPGLGRVAGTIDRLLVGPARVRVVDFKSNAAVPAAPAAVPEGILRQMGAYAALLERIYPGRSVETAILWTRTGALMPLPPEIVRQALARAAKS